VLSDDFNNDAKLDLIVAFNSDNKVGVLLGNGNGTFQNQTTYFTGFFPRPVITSDFNNDTKLNPAVTNAHSNSISLLLGNGNGTFQRQAHYSVGNEPHPL
jgi:hypothetical protein